MILIQGPVIRGRGASRTIGFPTANIRYVPDAAVVLKRGVWTARALVQNISYDAVAIVDVWKQPDGSPSVEVHLFDFDQDLYDQPLQVELHEWFKDLTVCPDFESLKRQIAVDAAEAKRLLNEQRNTPS